MPKYLPVTAKYVLDGESVPYVWKRKAVKNYNLRVHADGALAISSPVRTTQAQIEKFLADHADFIRRARARMAARQVPIPCALSDGECVPIWGVSHTVFLLKSKKSGAYVQDGRLFLALQDPTDAAARVRLFWRFAKEELTVRMQALTQAYAPRFLDTDTTAPTVALRRMKSRWGACFYRQSRVTYSTNLIFVHPECLVYVVCHELAHFRHPDHSKDFYACLARILPAHQELRAILRRTQVPQLLSEHPASTEKE